MASQGRADKNKNHPDKEYLVPHVYSSEAYYSLETIAENILGNNNGHLFFIHGKNTLGYVAVETYVLGVGLLLCLLIG